MDTHLFHRVRVDEDDVILLRELVRSDDDLAKDSNGLTNRFREPLLRYFSQVMEFCPSVDEPRIWDLLLVIPTPEAAAKASTKVVAEILEKHRIRRVDASGVLEVLRQRGGSPSTVTSPSSCPCRESAGR